MGIFNKKSAGGRKKATTGFSELNRRTYEASPTGRTGQIDPTNTVGYAGNPNAKTNRRGKGANTTASGTLSDYSRRGQQQKYADARKAQDKKKRNKKIIIVIASVIVAILVAIGIAFGVMMCNMNSGMGNIGLTPTSLDKPFYMVLMGVDSSDQRKGESGGTDEDYRSDSMILARIAADEKKVTLMSIHRDIEVDMGGEYGVQKINAAHSIGGPEMVIKCVSKLAGVNINHYAEINFDGFCAAVEDLGGIDINVPIEINDELVGSYSDGKSDMG